MNSPRLSLDRLDGEWMLREPNPGASAIDDTVSAIADAHLARTRAWARSLVPSGELESAPFDGPSRVPIDLAALGPGFGRKDLSDVVRTLEGLDSFIVMTGGQTVPNTPFLHRQHELWRPSVINGNRVLAAVGAAHTPNFSGIDRSHRVLNEVCEHVERLFGCQADASVFVSQGQEHSSGLHADTGELLIIPLEGPKRWRVLRPSVAEPLRPSHEAALEGPVAFDGVLAPGEGLVVPRGWPHEVHPVGPLSISLTVAFYRPVPASSIAGLANAAVDRPLLRLGFSPGSSTAVVERLRSAVDDLFSADRLLDAICRRRSAVPLRNHGDLAWDLLDGRLNPEWLVSCRSPGGFFVGSRPGSPDHLVTADRVVGFEAQLAPVMRDILSTRATPVEQLVNAHPGKPVPQAIVDLLADGLLDVQAT